MKTVDIWPWFIKSTDGGQDGREYRESIFSQGNGYMGTRGFRPDERGKHEAWRSTFISGFYEYIRPGITDLVNQPDFSAVEVRINGRRSDEMLIESFTQTLSLQDGLLTWDYVTVDDEGNRTRLCIEKFISMACRHSAGLRMSVTPQNFCGAIHIATGIDGTVKNLPISDDQLQENTEMACIWGDIQSEIIDNGGLLTSKTAYSGHMTAEGYSLRSNIDGLAWNTVVKERSVSTYAETYLRQGQTWTVEKRIAVACGRDRANPIEIVRHTLRQMEEAEFDQLLAATRNAWNEIWQDVDIKITGNDIWQGAMRYNIFQLVQAAPTHDGYASIGARGLTHGRYKGCYFWDTEIFMLPFFTCTRPETARDLLMYRFHTLEDALESAKRFSAKGARYSWMASDTGFEQCETWDTGCCEIHVTADIAYAVGFYYEQTGDLAFLRDYGCEILLQTARYWTDRFNYCESEDRYHLLFVKGPDEYCGVTTDDFYTVKMAAHNLHLAVSAAAILEQACPAEWRELRERLSLSSSELATWQDIAEKICVSVIGERGPWKQDATFEYLQPLDIQANKNDDTPLYRKISFDRLQRYQVLKQPAVLMYMALHPNEFTQEELEAAWEYYEPKTLHDSSLSFGIHALLAARLNRFDDAVRYFEKSLLLDLRNIMQNTGSEGIHMASLGATWQAAVFGFGGVSVKDGCLHCENRLPEQIDAMEFQIRFHGTRYKIVVHRNQEPMITAI